MIHPFIIPSKRRRHVDNVEKVEAQAILQNGCHGSNNSISSEENNCGISLNFYYHDFPSDSSETPTSEEGGSFTIPLLQQPETTEQNLPEKKKGNHLHAKGGKILPKKKRQQKTTFMTNHNMACRLLSPRDHDIKELKNEVAVLRNKLETFTVENKILSLNI
ncbi:LCA5L: Lebercilin-like [Crotalus adamanteus]|uniref:LCA5L: Lebercilin-like n=1 Tax=Crotalus adamanteus TaxID=8729 RepID=A0AAW1BJB1_CROAD